MGHFSRDCPQDDGGGGGKRTCHTCGSEDHLARECPDKANKGNDFYTKSSKADDSKVPSSPAMFSPSANLDQLAMTRTTRVPPSTMVLGLRTSLKTVDRPVAMRAGMPLEAVAPLPGKGGPACCWALLPGKGGAWRSGRNRTSLNFHRLNPRNVYES